MVILNTWGSVLETTSYAWLDKFALNIDLMVSCEILVVI